MNLTRQDAPQTTECVQVQMKYLEHGCGVKPDLMESLNHAAFGGKDFYGLKIPEGIPNLAEKIHLTILSLQMASSTLRDRESRAMDSRHQKWFADRSCR